MRAGRTLVTWPVSGPQMWIRGPERVGPLGLTRQVGDKARMRLNPGDPTRPFQVARFPPLPAVLTAWRWRRAEPLTGAWSGHPAVTARHK